MNENTNFRISYIIGKKPYEKYIDIVDYPYKLRKVKVYFYDGNFELCSPVEKQGDEINIILEDNFDKTRISKYILNISKIIGGCPDGAYLVDLEKGKIIFDFIQKKELVPFTVVYIKKERPSSYILCCLMDQDGNKKLYGLNSKFLKFAETLTESNYMIEPANSIIDEFGAGVFLRINQNMESMDKLDSTIYKLADFFNPRGKPLPEPSDLVLEGFTQIVDGCFKSNNNLQKIEKILLSDILKVGYLPKNLENDIKEKEVELDVKPDGVDLTRAVIRGNRLYLYIKNLRQMIKEANEILALDFIVFMNPDTKKEITLSELENNPDLNNIVGE